MNFNNLPAREVTQKMLERLAIKFPSPAYAFLSQVRNGTGYLNVTRTADAMVMSLWPSRGLELMGFEIKVSRTDWLKELKNPEKAEELAQFCDRWYLLVSDPEIVKEGELPPKWGLMAATGRGGAIKMIKEAPQLKAIKCDRLFLASLMRNITEKMIARDLIDGRLKDEYESGKRIGQNDSKDAVRILAEFEEKSGVKMERWEVGNISEAVAEVLSGRNKTAKKELERIEKVATNIARYAKGEIDRNKIRPYC